MELQLFKQYWFWSKRKNKPECLYVVELRDKDFSFNYDGKRWSSSYNYADGKLFERIDEVDGYDEWRKEIELEKSRLTYRSPLSMREQYSEYQHWFDIGYPGGD